MVLDKQEVGQVALNSANDGVTEDHWREFQKSQVNLREAQKDVAEVHNQERDLRRNVPTLASDFQFEVEQLSANIEVLVEQNAEMKSEISCLGEDKTALGL